GHPSLERIIPYGEMILDRSFTNYNQFICDWLYFHNRVFDSIDTLENHLVSALCNLENAPALIKSITGWDWIINAVSSAN
uniref:hypothetical protein n=1 Tax=Nitrosomonas sp. Nm33 TaxID=133724 RepID=UPI0008975D3A